MDDELKRAWQAKASGQKLSLDPGLVLNEVRRNERQFAATIYRRDLREVGVALLLVPVWLYLGVRQSSHWSWYLVIPALLWIAGFFIVDRIRQRRKQPGPGEDLRRSIEYSLAKVEHQIWLLRNVLWWYLLPLFVTLTAYPAYRAWMSRDDGLSSLGELLGSIGVYVAVFGFVYWLNQFCVRKELEPQREELRSLLKSLEG